MLAFKNERIMRALTCGSDPHIFKDQEHVRVVKAAANKHAGILMLILGCPGIMSVRKRFLEPKIGFIAVFAVGSPC